MLLALRSLWESIGGIFVSTILGSTLQAEIAHGTLTGTLTSSQLEAASTEVIP